MSPQRSCDICRMRTDKQELLRWVKQDAQMVKDEHQTTAGRGYYSCNTGCATRINEILKRRKK